MPKPNTPPPSNDETAWRSRNAGSILLSANSLFEKEVLRATQTGEFGWVSRVHLALFRNLDLEGSRLTEIAARAGITKQSMQDLVDKAESHGVVERRPATDDRRAKIVAFTPLGIRMMNQLRAGIIEAERRLALSMGAEFLSEMKRRLTSYLAESDRRDKEAA